ncbi:MAG: acyl-CoA thioester hydrolase/BAAT C-terminal domain-containing protein [Bdellovibrionota bacterium]
MKNSQITKDEMDSKGIPATIMYPAGGGKHPTILVLSGSEGGKSLERACLLASKGFTTIALAYFNYNGLPDYLIKIPLEYFPKQLEQLRFHRAVNLENLAVTGASKGGELSLLLGAHFQIFKAVVAYVPSAVVWSGIDYTGTAPIQSS